MPSSSSRPSATRPCRCGIAELLLEAGLPAGILNVVNGDKEAVDTLLTDRAHPGDRLRRLVGHRRIHLFDRLRARQTRAMLRRRQEPHDRDAGRRHGPGGRCADRRRLRLGRRTLHGDLGRGAGRQEDRRHSDREAHPARREPQDRPVDRRAGRLRPDGDQGASQQGARLCRYRRQGRRQARGRRPRLQDAGLRERQSSWAAACSTT